MLLFGPVVNAIVIDRHWKLNRPVLSVKAWWAACRSQFKFPSTAPKQKRGLLFDNSQLKRDGPTICQTFINANRLQKAYLGSTRPCSVGALCYIDIELVNPVMELRVEVRNDELIGLGL